MNLLTEPQAQARGLRSHNGLLPSKNASTSVGPSLALRVRIAALNDEGGIP